MSQPAVGTFKGGNAKFMGSFVAQKNIAMLEGSFNTGVVAFDVPIATIIYDKISDFNPAATYDIELTMPPCFVGKSTIDIKFINGSIKLPLTGMLVKEIPARQSVTGFGKFVVIPIP